MQLLNTNGQYLAPLSTQSLTAASSASGRVLATPANVCTTSPPLPRLRTTAAHWPSVKAATHLAVAGATLLGRCVTRVLFVHAQVDGIRLGRAAGGNATSIASSLLAALTYFVPLDVNSGEETSETHWF